VDLERKIKNQRQILKRPNKIKKKREKNYAKALEKAAEETKHIFEEEDNELHQSLARARETKRKSNTEELLVQRVHQATKMRENQPSSAHVEDSLVFTDTTEFIRAIQLEDAPTTKKKTEQMDIDAIREEEHQKVIKSQLEQQETSDQPMEDTND